MKTFFDGLFLLIVPFLLAVSFIAMFVFGLVVVFYLLFWGLIAGAAIYFLGWAYRFITEQMCGGRKDKMVDHEKKRRRRRRGRIFEHQDKNE